jgi:hypothetical protein
MREHQIVITLKPEQFLEVQRMARMAGAKSMGMFVRQSLLSALGIDGQSQPPTSLTAGPDVKRVTNELRRLHAELKTFVAESLNNVYIGPAAEPVPADSLYQEGTLAQPALTSISTFLNVEETMAEFEQARDELEQMAQKAFAISPRLGPMEDIQEPAQAPATEQDSGKENPAVGRDPLDELLEDPLMARLDDYASKSRGDLAERAVENAEGKETDEPEEEEIFDVPLPMSERPARQAQVLREQNKEDPPPAPPPPPPPPPPRPGSGPPPTGLSGGPPPRRRQ